MACLNETFAFSQPHFPSPVGANFGYADDTISPGGTHHHHSPHLTQPPPSPSPRFQPSPQPFLKHPIAASTPPAQGIPSPRTRSPGRLQGKSSSPEKPRHVSGPRSQDPQPDEAPEARSDPPHSPLQASVSSASEGDPNLKGNVSEDSGEKEEKEAAEDRADKEEGKEAEQKEKGEEGGKHPEPQENLTTEEQAASGSGAPSSQRGVLAVRKKSPVGEGVQKECLGVSPSSGSRTMGDSKENKSPRSSTSDNLQVLSLKDHYEVERELGRGTYGKVVLAKCRHTGTQVALKLLPKTSTKLRDFQREFQLSYFLSPHGNIIDTYNVAFETKSSYVFAQEHAALGDLFDAIPPQVGMREADAKAVIKQLASALEFMHSKHLVHRDIKPENVLVMAVDFSRVKLMDFGMTRKHGTMVRKTNGSIPYTPPEVCEAVRNENILVSASADVWALAVLLFCMLTGNFPWENADIGDMYFKEFVLWQRRKTTKLPSQWRRFSPRAMKYFRKALDIKPERRCDVEEIHKYLSDAWTQKPRTNDSEEDSGSSASCDHMDELATMLKDHGIETRVDRRLRERRISEWLLSL